MSRAFPLTIVPKGSYSLRDYAAGDAVAGVARRISFHIVGFGVDDERCASVAEHGVGVGAEVYILVLELPSGFAFLIDTEVRHVAGMVAFGIFQTVLFPVGIEMRAGRFEIRGIAFGILMEMNGVLTGGKTVKMKLEADT